MSERAIVDNIRRLLTNRGAWHTKTTGVATVGIPDILACHNGKFIALEVKTPGRRPRPTQQRQLDLITRANGLALCVTNTHQVTAELDRIDQEAKP